MEYALDGLSGIRMLKDAVNDQDDFDIVLLDWKMPDMDGIETAKEIRKDLPPETLIIILTAYDYSNIEEEALKAGVDGFISKPFFIANLQKTIENLDKPEVIEEKEVISLEGLNILAAEDNELNAEILTEILHLNGAEVTIEPNGLDLVNKFKKAEVNKYDLILMDIQMPVMDGNTAAYEIRKLVNDSSLSLDKREESKNIPIIAMTANAFTDDVQKAFEAGMNAHIAKPLDIKVLKETINNLKKSGE